MTIRHIHNLRDQQAASRVQDEVITAREIQKDNPDMTWTQCLQAAKEAWDHQPVFQ